MEAKEIFKKYFQEVTWIRLNGIKRGYIPSSPDFSLESYGYSLGGKGIPLVSFTSDIDGSLTENLIFEDFVEYKQIQTKLKDYVKKLFSLFEKLGKNLEEDIQIEREISEILKSSKIKKEEYLEASEYSAKNAILREGALDLIKKLNDVNFFVSTNSGEPYEIVKNFNSKKIFIPEKNGIGSIWEFDENGYFRRLYNNLGYNKFKRSSLILKEILGTNFNLGIFFTDRKIDRKDFEKGKIVPELKFANEAGVCFTFGILHEGFVRRVKKALENLFEVVSEVFGKNQRIIDFKIKKLENTIYFASEEIKDDLSKTIPIINCWLTSLSISFLYNPQKYREFLESVLESKTLYESKKYNEFLNAIKILIFEYYFILPPFAKKDLEDKIKSVLSFSDKKEFKKGVKEIYEEIKRRIPEIYVDINDKRRIEEIAEEYKKGGIKQWNMGLILKEYLKKN